MAKNLPAMQETQVQSLVRKIPRRRGWQTHASILAWRSPWTEEPDGPQSMGSQRAGHDRRLTLHFRWKRGASPVAQLVKNLPAMLETPIRFLGWEDSLEKG